jgi:biotin carboxylase
VAPGGGRPRLLLLIPTTTYRAEAFVEAAQRLDVDLTVASEHDSTFSLTEPDKLLTLDFTNPEYAAEQVKAFATEHPLAAVFGVDDQTVVVAAHASAVMGLRHNSVVAAKSAGDKYRQRVLLWEKGVPVPEFRLFPLDSDPRHVSESVSYPCVLKPVDLTASRGVVRANDPAECEHGFERVREIVRQARSDAPGWATPGMVVEQYVSGPEYALEGWLQDGGLHVLALFDKPDPLEGPYFAETIYVTPSRTSAVVQGKLTHCAESAARALGLNTGPVHVELRYNDAGPWLIELAARPIGGKCGQVLRFGPNSDVSLEQLVLGRTLGRVDEMPVREDSAVAVMMIPVPRAGTLDRVDGVEAALGVPLVTDVIVTAHRGQELVPLPDDSRYIGFIFARGDAPELVEQAVREANQLIEFVIT